MWVAGECPMTIMGLVLAVVMTLGGAGVLQEAETDCNEVNTVCPGLRAAGAVLWKRAQRA